MKRVAIIGMLFLMMSGISLYSEPWNDGFSSPYMNLSGILNPNNMRMNHTMSFMTGFSSGGKGFYQSVYTNHLFYSLHPNLDLNLDLNFVNYGTTTWDNSFSISANDDNRTQVLPEFSLHYRPSDRTSIRIEFRSMRPDHRYNNWRW